MIRPYSDPDRSASIWRDCSDADWNQWAFQIRERVDTAETLARVLELSSEERRGLEVCAPVFRFAVTPYYLLLADRKDPACPIRRQIVPRPEEQWVALGERGDPLGEESLEVAPNLIHRYPDRALLLATDRCPIYCRFCTRRRIVGRVERQATQDLLKEALDYVRAHPEIKEVIVSGGDALMLGDKVLDHLFAEIRGIPHVDIIRVASRMPAICPMRITDSLVAVLKKHQPVYVMTHFNHPRECTEAANAACSRLVENGIVVYNQSVLLRDINDSAEIIGELNRRLVAMRVTPYYLHQCDMSEGIEHFRTPLETGIEIIDRLRGHMSGLSVPQLCVDVPGGLGKVTVQPQWMLSRQGRRIQFRTYNGQIGEYIEPEEPGNRGPTNDKFQH